MNKAAKESIATVRSLIVDSVEYAKHGHMGGPLGSAPMGYELFRNHLNHNPKNPNWFNRDRFILTSGHSSILLYSLLHLSGYDLTIDDLKSFRQLDSKTPGHPEVFQTEGVEATTGPLGQGFAMTVGFAIAETHLRERFNRDRFNVVDHYTYTICGDGDLEEGVAMEAAAIAGNLGLGKLIVLYDSNDITSDGPLEESSRENKQEKFSAMNWQTILVEDGNNLEEISRAIKKAQEKENKPTLIEVKTIIGFGSTLQGTEKIHSNPVGAKEAQHIKESFTWDYDDFFVPKEIKTDFNEVIEKGEETEKNWHKLFEEYKEAYPDLGKELEGFISNEISISKEVWKPFEDDKMATRAASGKVLNRLYHEFPKLIGGSADLASSNKTTIDNYPFMNEKEHIGPNLHFGIREFSMAAITNGITLHGGVRGYCGTFLIFSDYMRPAIRLSSVMNIPATYLMTHDSLHVGQDGPTHQPVEHLISLRAMPNLVVYRPADANETLVGWKLAIESKDNPYLLSLGRHDVPVLDNVDFKGAEKGGYVLSKASDKPDVILIATGSEVEMALKAKEKLSDFKVNVVSLPSWELFDKQTKEYKESVVPSSIVNKASIELGSTIGWSQYVGTDGISLGVNKFGKSAPADDLLNDYGFTVDYIVDEVLKMVERNKGK
ncbi:MAG: transketolase [Tetragenococcus koreensis]|uniref:Transketolase n=1 Tax=Tetragenococcus halophilus TaxID=51669 RepID=A0AB35HLM8_TETHA|nr:transketolase [Tetragenococcus halophilus]MDN6140085.1 transketolase [Tetragenococcus koreensis]MDN6570994.1 transketolase [Staphylococcus equorum]MCF1686186.1 transketolase [Tetragenococcus halophilus]MCO8297081.1 transketolase [Tetragenococcus halophilus]MDN6732693.1 transketolase [Tetragenococcus koreensis]